MKKIEDQSVPEISQILHLINPGDLIQVFLFSFNIASYLWKNSKHVQEYKG